CTSRPPGLTRLPYTTLFRSPVTATTPFGEAGVYNDGGDFMPDKVIPFGYYVRKLDEKMAVGLGIFAPFGTSTDYAQGSLASGFADETMLTAIDIQPKIGRAHV